MGMGGQRHAPAALPQGKEPGTNCTGGEWDPRSVWTGAENLARTGIRSQDRPARSESQYRLSYPGPVSCVWIISIHLCHLFAMLLLSCVLVSE